MKYLSFPLCQSLVSRASLPEPIGEDHDIRSQLVSHLVYVVRRTSHCSIGQSWYFITAPNRRFSRPTCIHMTCSKILPFQCCLAVGRQQSLRQASIFEVYLLTIQLCGANSAMQCYGLHHPPCFIAFLVEESDPCFDTPSFSPQSTNSNPQVLPVQLIVR